MFRLASVADRAVLLDGDGFHDLATLAGDPAWADPMIAIAQHRELHHLASTLGGRPLDGIRDDVEFGICVPRPSQVFAIGLNYLDHAAESNLELPTAPLAFTKFSSCLQRPTGDIELSGDRVDWEVELVVVIGTRARRVPVEGAWDHVAGLTLGQDVSDRAVQMQGRPAQFSLGKSFATYGPIGPAVVSPDAFADRDDVGLWCEVSGERMQTGRTRDLIFPVPVLVAYLSSICTLEPGDLIFTGTPSGVGMGRGRFLRPGDVVVSGAEGIGEMSNRCVVGSAPLEVHTPDPAPAVEEAGS